MASIYDIARIKSGDPMGRASEGAREASALFAQYEHQKDIIEEINREIAEAEKKAGKNKLGYGLAGSLLGGGLGLGLTALTGGAAAPSLLQSISPYMSTLGAGLGSGIAEKYRQDRTGATKGLERLEKKLKGRKQYEDVKDVREGMEGSLDKMLMSGARNAMTMDMLMPSITKEASKYTQTSPELVQEATTYQPMDSSMVEGVSYAEPGRITSELVSESQSAAANVFGVDIPITDAAKQAFDKKAGIGRSIFGETSLGKMLPDGLMQNELFQNPWMQNLLKILGPQLMAPSMPKQRRFTGPTFTNPYGGGGGY